MKLYISRVALAVIGSFAFFSSTARAEEGGAGHYLPGSFSSSLDITPTELGFSLGPVLNIIQTIGDKKLAIQAKWLPELDTKNRLEGDWVWLSVGMAF